MGKAGVANMTIRGAMAGVSPAWRRIASAIVLVPLFVWLTTSAAPRSAAIGSISTACLNEAS